MSTQPQSELKYIDLFAGMGSFTKSLNKLGMKCVMSSDICESAVKNYKHNFGEDEDVRGDICTIDPTTVEPYDILCAGIPCQPFSQAGHHQGFADKKGRGTMFSQVMRFVTVNAPKVVVIENVAALLNHDSGKSFGKIKSDLEQEGYTVAHKVLKCSDFGIPQMRRRLFIVGIKGVSEETMSRFFDMNEYKKTVTLSAYLGKNFAKDVAYTLRCGGKCSPINDRHNWDGYWVDGKEYRLTIEDGLKLQGFEGYNLTGTKTEQWKMLGNTIPTVLTELVGRQILKTLNEII